MEYSKENVMTRKEYLKSKNKKKFDFSKLKYVLLIIVVLLLSIYLYKQLNLYNNVTKIANKVVEETALAKTMTMYYIQNSYTKEDTTCVMLFKSFDDSRTKIENTEGFNDIIIENDILYGLKENNIYMVNISTNDITKITERKVKKFIVKNSVIYCYVLDNKNSGVYKIDIKNNIEKQIILSEIYDFDVTDKNIYIVSKGTTSKSIIRFDLEGKNKKEISGKYIVSGIKCIENKIYFTTTKNSKLYVIYKDNITKLTENIVKDIKNVVEYDGNVYYINSSDSNTLYLLNQNKNERIIKKNIEDIQIDGNIIYYRIKGLIGIFKYDIESKNTAQVTSVRTSKYICKN